MEKTTLCGISFMVIAASLAVRAFGPKTDQSKPKIIPEAGLGWVKRGVEETLVGILTAGSAVIHIRGRRRIGKTSTVQRLHRLFNIKSFRVNQSFSVAAVRAALLQEDLTDKPLVVYIDEIQRCSTAIQEDLQELIDDLRGGYLNGTRHACLILCGSNPRLGDEVLENPSAPLYKRATNTINILPFLPHEMVSIFKQHNITDPTTILSLLSATNGIPVLLDSCKRRGGFINGAFELIYKAAGEGITEHALNIPTDEVGDLGSSILESFTQIRSVSKNDQLKECAKRINKAVKELQPGLDRLIQLGMVAEECGLGRHSFWGITPAIEEIQRAGYPRLVVVDHVEVMKRLLNNRIPSAQALQQFEGGRLEEWVRRIILDRRSRQLPIFPAPEYGTSTLGLGLELIRGHWKGFVDLEIDLIVVCEDAKEVIFGSVKRTRSALHEDFITKDLENKVTAFNKLVQQRPGWHDRFVRICAIPDNNATFPHFTLAQLLEYA